MMGASISLHSSRLRERFGNLTAWSANHRTLVCMVSTSLTLWLLTDGPGEYSQDDWLELVKPNILTRMAEYEEDQIEFSILSLAKDPLIDLTAKLAANVKCLELVRELIDAHEEGSSTAEPAVSLLENTILGPDASYALTQDNIDEAVIAADQREGYQACSIDALIHDLQKLSGNQLELRASIKEEQQSNQADDDYAAGRRYDYGPAVRQWARFLARKRMFESLE
jgi:ubiquitin carboxyl-terminal hydrolase L5